MDTGERKLGKWSRKRAFLEEDDEAEGDMFDSLVCSLSPVVDAENQHLILVGWSKASFGHLWAR